MNTPFDKAIAAIAGVGYHNHRQETHSDVISDALITDVAQNCAWFREDLKAGVVRIWKNVRSPGDRRRKVDLFVGEPDSDGGPDLGRVRIAVEHKSVVTAHRNATNRFDDLKKIVEAVQGARPEAIVIATVLVGVAERVLNVPDQVHKFYRDDEMGFETKVRPRLSTGDASLFEEFNWAISENGPNDPARTIEHLLRLPKRGIAQTFKVGFDSLLLVPVRIDNVNPPTVPRPNSLGVDVDAEYLSFLERTCSAYRARWHM